ncbi:unnamed protein product [Victoria cruziana]
MGNICCGGLSYLCCEPSDPRSESSKIQNSAQETEGKVDNYPIDAKEIEDLRGDSAANPLVVFTFTELKLITENFKKDRVLGGGGFGSVYRGCIPKDLREGLEPLVVAVKVHDGEKSFQGHREWLAEVIYLGKFSHPNLVKLVGYCCEEDNKVLVYEYMAGGSVETQLFSSNFSYPLTL